MAALETSFDGAEVDARERPWWMEHAVCKGQTEVFFAPHAERPSARERREQLARQICTECAARVPCRDYARLYRELGFWGGESEVERALAGFPPTTPVIGMPRRRATR